MGNIGRFLTISDLQAPFEHPDALKFCDAIRREYKIPNENIYNVGDEIDGYWGGLWDKSPDASLTANQEIKETRDRLKRWYARFPRMKLCTSNHGSRWIRKAFAAQIPSQLLITYQKLIEAPPGWVWKKHWKVQCKNPFIVEHGDDWGGQYPHKNAAIHNGMSTVMGHHHSLAGIEHIKTNGIRAWGMVTGCLIDFDQFAFEYAKNHKFKPLLGVGVVLDEGKTPIWIPFETFR